MDLSVVMKELEEKLNQRSPSYSEPQGEWGSYHPGAKGHHEHCDRDHEDEGDPNMKLADTLMAMFKGKGGSATCWTCGLTGHIARNCAKGYEEAKVRG